MNTRLPGGEPVAEQLLAIIQPIRRAGRPDDVAAMALFLASDDSEWVTGTAMVVDGGFTAGSAMFGQNRGPAPVIPGNFAGPSFEK